MNSIKEAKEWFDYANLDFQSAVFLKSMLPVPYEIICYHCQQSAEKFLKGFLILNKVEIIRTHDLVLLNNKCMEIDDSFQSIMSECESLTVFSIQSRYPGNVEITEADMNEAVAFCEKIKKFMEDKFNFPC